MNLTRKWPRALEGRGGVIPSARTHARSPNHHVQGPRCSKRRAFYGPLQAYAKKGSTEAHGGIGPLISPGTVKSLYSSLSLVAPGRVTKNGRRRAAPSRPCPDAALRAGDSGRDLSRRWDGLCRNAPVSRPRTRAPPEPAHRAPARPPRPGSRPPAPASEPPPPRPLPAGWTTRS